MGAVLIARFALRGFHEYYRLPIRLIGQARLSPPFSPRSAAGLNAGSGGRSGWPFCLYHREFPRHLGLPFGFRCRFHIRYAAHCYGVCRACGCRISGGGERVAKCEVCVEGVRDHLYRLGRYAECCLRIGEPVARLLLICSYWSAAVSGRETSPLKMATR